MFIKAFYRETALADIPNLECLMVAAHQTVLFSGVEIDADQLVSLTATNPILLTALIYDYLFDFLSQMTISLALAV